jgi:DNA-directed RNA polymerase specialized sigma24 family protein
MRLDPDMDRRCQNWARYRLGSKIIAPTIEARVDGSGWDAPTVIPTNQAEAEETERGIKSLEAVLQRALMAWYVDGGGLAQRARKCECSETTLRDRVGLAHRNLGQWLCDQANAQMRERVRVEALQAQMSMVRAGFPVRLNK